MLAGKMLMRFVTFQTFDKSEKETWTDQPKDNKDIDKGKVKDNAKDIC